MNWFNALQNFNRYFPADHRSSFSWLPVEDQIKKNLGLTRVVVALRQGENLTGEDGSEVFSPRDRAEILKRFDRRPVPWIGPKLREGEWLGLWPILLDKVWTACFVLGPKKNGRWLNKEEDHFMRLAVDRASLYAETRQLWKFLEKADRESSLGWMSSAMAHEIRNPLAAMGTLVQLLPRKKDDPTFMDDFQKVMNKEIHHLTYLTKSFLDLSRSTPETKGPVDLGEVVAHVVQLLKPLFSMNGVKFIVKEGRNLHLKGERHQLQSLVMNLLQNAFQSAGPGGTVRISAGLSRQKGNGKWIELSVADSGPGIDRKDRGKIFEPHFSTKNGGTGLGLAICRKIILAHGGRLRLRTSPRNGAQFNVLLPFSPKE